MTHHPIMEMLRSLLEVIRSNWHINAMLRLFKTNVLTSQFKRSSYLIDLLENFVLERGIYGKRWLDRISLVLISLVEWDVNHIN